MKPLSEIKKIPIESILSDCGVTASSRGPKYLMYCSPLHDDLHPSFAVDTARNRWHDFALGLDGSNIDLVLLLKLASSCGDAIKYLDSHFPEPVPEKADTAADAGDGTTVTSVTRLMSHRLKDYITIERGIPSRVASRYLSEVHCLLPSGKEVYGAGMANRSGGYALRSPWFKLAVPPSDITVLQGVSHDECVVFEGVLSFLSFISLKGDHEGDAVILNSVTNVRKAAETLPKYRKIHCFLDNDDSGRKALEDIRSSCKDAEVADESGMYEGFNDVNDLLVDQIKKNYNNNQKTEEDGI